MKSSLYSLNVGGASSLDVRQVGRTTKAMLNPSLLDYFFEIFSTCYNEYAPTDNIIQFNICTALVNALLLAN